MAHRIGEYVLAGELRNTRRNGVFGWIEFAPDYGIRVELTGNLQGILEGKHVRFRVTPDAARPPLDLDSLPDVVESLADRQIGVVGEMTMRRRKVVDIPTEEFLKLDKQEQQKHVVEKEVLYLEWFSQNGRVVTELANPDLVFVDESTDSETEPPELEELEEGSYGIGFTEIHIDRDGVTHTENFELGDYDDDDDDDDAEESDPYGLFGNDLDRHVAESLGSLPGDSEDDDDEDPETKAMYEQWDEIFAGKKDEPISYLLQNPLKLPKVENVRDEQEAENLVRSILAQLALLSVALDVCEHFSSMDTYRVLMNDILPTAKVHPNLAASEMVQHYSTSDFCKLCESEIEAEEAAGAEQESSSTDADESDSTDADSDDAGSDDGDEPGQP